MTKLVIDSREHHIIEAIKFPYIKRTLDVGDFLLLNELDEPIMVIERKTIADLESSIVDGRYHEQKARLIKFGCENKECMVSYLIEINTLALSTRVLGAITNTQIRDNIHCILSSSIRGTLSILQSLLKNFEGFKTRENERYTQNIKVKKKDNITINSCFILQLMQIPLISENVAAIFASRYNHIGHLIQELKLDRNKVFKDIPTFGPVKKQHMIDYLGIDDDYLYLV